MICNVLLIKYDKHKNLTYWLVQTTNYSLYPTITKTNDHQSEIIDTLAKIHKTETTKIQKLGSRRRKDKAIVYQYLVAADPPDNQNQHSDRSPPPF